MDVHCGWGMRKTESQRGEIQHSVIRNYTLRQEA